MDVADQKRREVVQYLMRNNVLVTGKILSQLQQNTLVEAAHSHIQSGTHEHVLQALLPPVSVPTPPTTPSSTVVKGDPTNVTIVNSYEQPDAKLTYKTFVSHFNARYKKLERMLRQRTELKNVTAVARLQSLPERSSVALVGLVYDKGETKNGNISLKIEDPTGVMHVIVTKNDPDLFAQAQDVMLDEVVGIVGMLGNNVLFCSKILYPDIPLGRELKKAPDEVYAAFISDFHIGSNLFTPKTLNRFIDWMAGKNDLYPGIASKVKYLFIVGDIVDSVGVYPSQEKELVIKDVYKQFEEAHKFLSRVPKDVHMIICPGNHEPTRIAEPQPVIDKDFGKLLWDLPNVTMITNPGVVNIHSSQNFPGFDVLLYHGFSYTYYGDRVNSIRNSGKNVSERIELIMRYTLQRRHLAPTYGSNQFIPTATHDPLVIDQIPDIFCSGHIHKSSISQYRGVTVISGSCFQEKSSYQEKFGHEPDPGKVPILNLQTRQGKVLDFYGED